MRYILFRGKPTKEVLENESLCKTLPIKDGFVYGNLIYNDKQPYIVGQIADVNDEYCSMEWWCPVKPETVGQFSGLKDKNGRLIFEDDFLLIENDDGVEYKTQVWNERGTLAADVKCREYDYTAIGWFDYYSMEVIGNMHDNPRLLEETK